MANSTVEKQMANMAIGNIAVRELRTLMTKLSERVLTAPWGAVMVEAMSFRLEMLERRAAASQEFRVSRDGYSTVISLSISWMDRVMAPEILVAMERSDTKSPAAIKEFLHFLSDIAEMSYLIQEEILGDWRD